MTESFFQSTDSYRVQKTVESPVTFEGTGLHSGMSARITLHPAPANHGIIFLRTDLRKPAKILAHFNSVVSTSLATTLGIAEDPTARVSTVEHLMAALYALGITNTLIEVQGPEIPILDGSASPFIEGIRDTGITLQYYSTPTLRVLKPIKIYENGAICELLPRNRLRLTTSIDFPHPTIGTQIFALELTPERFSTEISLARTFGFQADLERLQSHRLALGASLDNVLAFSADGVINETGMRFTDECVRHKLLDALGDLALCGCWIEGEMVSFRGGHSIHLSLLKSLKQHPTHWEISRPEPLQRETDEARLASQVLSFRRT